MVWPVPPVEKSSAVWLIRLRPKHFAHRRTGINDTHPTSSHRFVLIRWEPLDITYQSAGRKDQSGRLNRSYRKQLVRIGIRHAQQFFVEGSII
jgi:hypothetical protein